MIFASQLVCDENAARDTREIFAPVGAIMLHRRGARQAAGDNRGAKALSCHLPFSKDWTDGWQFA
jgi:hypothetical protein